MRGGPRRSRPHLPGEAACGPEPLGGPDQMHMGWRSPKALGARSGSPRPPGVLVSRKALGGCAALSGPGPLPDGRVCHVCAGRGREQQPADEEGRREVTRLARRAESNPRDLDGGRSRGLSVGDQGPRVGSAESGIGLRRGPVPGTRGPGTSGWGWR